MKNKFVADGPYRFMRAKRALRAEPVEKKYAAMLATATSDQKAKIRAQMAEESAQRGKILNHRPSVGSLW